MSGVDGPAVDVEIVAEVRRRIESHSAHQGGGGGATRERVAAALIDAGLPHRGESMARLADAVRREVTGAGPLQDILDEPGVTDVLINGSSGVWIDRGEGLERIDVELGGRPQIRALAVRLAASGGSRLDDAEPMVDARLADGSRVHVVLDPIAIDGPLISLRTLAHQSMTLAELVSSAMIPMTWAGMLDTVVARGVPFLVSGATGTGKTTLLASLLARVPDRQRIVIIEESGELNPSHPHVVRLACRRSNVEGVGVVELSELVRQSLRMRPDRIVVGECRGAELRDLLAAFNTGHRGAATIHANSSTDVPARLEALGVLGGLDASAVTTQVVAGLRLVLHISRHRSHRWLSEVALLERDRGTGRLVSEVVATWDGRNAPSFSTGWRRLDALLQEFTEHGEARVVSSRG